MTTYTIYKDDAPVFSGLDKKAAIKTLDDIKTEYHMNGHEVSVYGNGESYHVIIIGVCTYKMVSM